MLKFSMKAGDILNWARYLNETPRRSSQNIARSLNSAGSALVRNLSMNLSSRTGISLNEASTMFRVREASAQDLTWQLDTSRVVTDVRVTSRLPISQRRWIKGRQREIQPGSLVRIVTFEDERVCQICLDAAAEGPYTIEEATAMIPLHPNCRCSVAKSTDLRPLPLRYETALGASPKGVEAALSMGQLSKVVLDNIEAALKVSLRVR